MVTKTFKCVTTAAFAATLCMAANAAAHFVWIKTKAEGGNVVVDVGFGEPGAFDQNLVERIKNSQARVVVDGKQRALSLELQKSEGCYRATVESAASAIVATCDYGVVARDGKPFQLTYFAKRLLGDPKSWSDQSVSDKLVMEAVATPVASGIQLTVLADGKPLSKGELHVKGPKSDGKVLTAGDDGTALWPSEGPGEYCLYVGRSLPQSGEAGGKKFDSVKQYATLTFHLDGPAAVAKSEKPAVDPKAAKLFVAARSNRNVWDASFPGFAANITINSNGQVGAGTIVVDPSGTVDLKIKGLDEKRLKSVQAVLDSMASHRIASTGTPENEPEVSFGKETCKEHPQGVLLEIADDKFHSVYRVKNNQIWVVTRQMGPNKMTISMLDNVTTSDGRYLPGIYNVSMWDQQGGLMSSSTTRDEWTTVGKHSLPKASRTVSTGKNKWDVLSIEYSNHKLLTPGLGN